MLFYGMGMVIIPLFIFFKVPGWVGICYSILLAAKMIVEGK